MLDFNLYYAQAAATSRTHAPRSTVPSRTTRTAKRIFRLGTRRSGREGSAR
jgi:hypothetical protein